MADGDSRRGSSAGRARVTGQPPSTRSALTVDVVLKAGVRAPGLGRWLQTAAPARARGGVTIAVVSDARVRGLNREYRKKDIATDVLSFPTDEPNQTSRGTRPSTSGSGPATPGPLLGDVVIAAGVARRQADEAGHSMQTELRILALHGLLHLLGYDHEHDGGQMARLERRLRLRAGLREGLIERARDANRLAAHAAPAPRPGARRR